MVVETVSMYIAQRLQEIFNDTGQIEKKNQDTVLAGWLFYGKGSKNRASKRHRGYSQRMI